MTDLDLLLAGGTALTMADDRLGIRDDAAVGVAGDEIAFVGDVHDAPSATRTIDATGCVVLPGLVNAHMHAGLTLLRGGAQDVSEIEWMDRALRPLAAAATREDRVAGARLGVAETLLSGATTVCEYADEVGDLVKAAHRPLGARVVAVETISEVGDDRADSGPDEPSAFDRGKGRAALERADGLFGRFGDDRLVEPAYGPQAADMVSRELLETVADHARAQNARLHVHVAQGERERRQLEARYGDGASAVSVLSDADAVGPDLVAVHCHGTTPAERDRLVEAGASMVGCPSSIAAIDGRVPPVAVFRERGAPVGLGTDQAPGPGHHDPIREAGTAATLSKVERTDPTAFPAWRALRAATVGGARALGLADRVGRLEAGTAADVVVCDLDRIGAAPSVRDPFHTAVPNLVYGGRDVVRDVVVAGEVVVRDGDLVTGDVEGIVADATERARALYDRAADDWRDAGSTLVDRVAAGWL